MNNLINIIIEYSKLSEDDKELFKTIINKDTTPVSNKDNSKRDFEVFKELLKKKDTTPTMVGTGKPYTTAPYFPPSSPFNPIISYYVSKDI